MAINHFMDAAWWKKKKYKSVIYFVNIPWDQLR